MAASAPAAAAAAATYFSPAAWGAGTAALLGAYLLYLICMASFMPRGRMVTDFKSKPAIFCLLMFSVVMEFLPVMIMPWAAMAVSGAWKAGLVYFPPVALHLGLNIAFEQHLSRQGHMVAVLASTVVNNMARIILSLAALVDMSLLGNPHPALWMVSCTQVAAFALVTLLVVPAIISQLPLQPPSPTRPAASNASG